MILQGAQGQDPRKHDRPSRGLPAAQPGRASVRRPRADGSEAGAEAQLFDDVDVGSRLRHPEHLDGARGVHHASAAVGWPERRHLGFDGGRGLQLVPGGVAGRVPVGVADRRRPVPLGGHRGVGRVESRH